MKGYVRFFLLLLFAVMLVGTFVFLWRKSRPEITVYEVVAPQKRTIEKKTIATGKVEPRDEVWISLRFRVLCLRFIKKLVRW